MIIAACVLPFPSFGQGEEEAVSIIKSPLWNLGLFFGIASFSLLVALIRYIVSKDRAYLFYSIFVIFNLLYFLHYYEYYGGVKVLFNFLFEELSPDIRIVFLLLGYVFYNYFAIEFLTLNKVNSQLAVIVKRCAWLVIGVIIIYLIFFHAGWNPVDGEFSKYKKLHDFTIISAAIIEIYAILKFIKPNLLYPKY